jgi:hypothetical protein
MANEPLLSPRAAKVVMIVLLLLVLVLAYLNITGQLPDWMLIHHDCPANAVCL